MKDYITEFLGEVSSGQVDIYNEFSLQHELGIFLRKKTDSLKIQFERNVAYFGFNKQNFAKKEIDIAVFSPNLDILQCVIEVKYPRNGQIPEQMFSFCNDIQFCEQLRSSGFKEAYVLILVEDKGFYSGKKDTGIYSFFRARKTINGIIQKPTGSEDTQVVISGSYQANWKTVMGELKYLLFKINT